MLKMKKAYAKRFISLMLTLMMTLIFMPQVPQLKANAVDYYGLAVAQIHVTSDNCNDILGNGIFSYVPSTKTLNIKGNFTHDRLILDNYGVSGLTINVEKDSTLYVPFLGDYKYTVALSFSEDTTITGNGKLTVKAAQGIYAGQDLTFDKANVCVKTSFSQGILGSTTGDYPKNDLTIKQSDITVSTPYYYAFSNFDNIILTNSEITTPSNAKVTGGDGANIRNSDGTEAMNVTIKAKEPESSNEGTGVGTFLPKKRILRASDLRDDIYYSLDEIKNNRLPSLQKRLQKEFVKRLIGYHNDYVSGKLIYLNDVKWRVYVPASVIMRITATLPSGYTDEEYINAIISFYRSDKIDIYDAVEILEDYFKSMPRMIVTRPDYTLDPGKIDIHEIEGPIKEPIERIPHEIIFS